MLGQRVENGELGREDDDNTAVLRADQPQSLSKVRH